jgi:DNA modification methylase
MDGLAKQQPSVGLVEGATFDGPQTSAAACTDAQVRAALDAIRRVPGNARRGERVFPHPFPARMPMAVADVAIEKLSVAGDVVLDPMAGSGTSIRAATVAGRRAYGVDLDPLAVILSRAFVTMPRAPVIHDLGAAVLQDAKVRLRRFKLATRLASLAEEDAAFLNYWFPDWATIKLFCLVESIDELVPEFERGAFYTIFSSLIVARSSGVSYALDLSRTRPHKDPNKTIRDPFELWSQRILEFARFSVRATSPKAAADIRHGDARRLAHIGDGSIDLALSSPPYGGAIDYIRASKFSLVFLDCQLSALREIRGTSIGSERAMRSPLGNKVIETLLPRRDTRRAGILRRYLSDLHQVLSETARVLRPSGIAMFAVGPSIASTTRYDAAEVMARLGEGAGLRLVGSCRRTLAEHNRSLPPPRRSAGAGTLDKRMNSECYVGFTKD